MSPYRSPAAETFRVDFGKTPKYPTLLRLLAVVCLLIPFVCVAGWLHWGGRINGSIALPGLIGGILLLQKRAGSVSYTRGGPELVVTWKSLLRSTTQTVPIAQLRGLTVWPRTDKNGKIAYYDLCLELADEAKLVLLTESEEPKLEPHRRAVSDFIVEHDLLPKLPPMTRPGP